MNKNILLIGGAGFIGSNLVKRFVRDETYRLVVLESPSADLRRVEASDRVTVLQRDLKDLDFLDDLLERFRITRVVHLVSTLLPGSTLEDYELEMNRLMLPTMRLMELCSQKGIMFVYFSSGGTIYGNSRVADKKETDELAPISYYGLSKCMMEEAIRFESRKSGLKYLVIRPSNPYGHGQNLYGRQGIIAVALGKFLRNEKLIVWGDGEIIRDYVYIDDLASCMYRLIENQVENEVINVGSGVGYSINEIVGILNEYLPEPLRTEYKEKRSVDVVSIVLDIEKLRSVAGFAPTGIREGIRSFVRETIQTK